jgi:hypothetical protein
MALAASLMVVTPGCSRMRELSTRQTAAHGQRLSQRNLARQLRGHGYHFPNQHLRTIAAAIGLESPLQRATRGAR